ncbi:carboxylating nicotinate-nucleotide diphosphorylase [Bacteroidales bacterium OttesenSCG-928-B11]|nr:carboxylating nicotinate-nucleotide diphosphorylase [Bacteroidales bacterium OttesenSCG-928-E04]MDL2308200.1 carboxylating nicotinate-nucleotide diphosphorylase [Bacteroidales bacterium OttesenSCG-928-C03]MDL2312586.1 carboxylating nicotinate-nucleotide diphosphorylase [Bacteroidales bacterium OttesenSCG-928-B11]MDL2325638.1 carboxylating nicotinate-nucleotide diphosphorylase [Bacteroidales bacterium OttesenSCG-928-A14]
MTNNDKTLSDSSHLYADQEDIIRQALIEDVREGDHSSIAAVPYTVLGEMKLMAKDNGIVAGIDVAKMVVNQVDPAITMETFKHDGDEIRNGDLVFILRGPARSMLTAERTLLNFMQRMSGIATQTRRYVDAVAGTGVMILDTRKTTPNMRIFEKYAVKVGGAENHRFGLFDMIMLKDNHVDFAGGIEKAIDATQEYLKKNNLQLKVEIETRSIDEVKRVLARGGVDRIMLDNFVPTQIVEAVKLIDGKYETEASGGITMESLREYAQTGVDYISVGALTHHIRSIDMSLKFVIHDQ